MSKSTEAGRRTIRHYAHELYPHPDEYEVQPLAEAVPYLYARAIGLGVFGTDWFDLGNTPEARKDEHGNFRAEFRLTTERANALIAARSAALHADALLQGLAGEEAWTWAESRANDESGEWIYERAVHYGVPVDQIKPYPVLAESPTHDHHDTTGNATGWGIVTRIDMPESECPDCTEPAQADEAGAR